MPVPARIPAFVVVFLLLAGMTFAGPPSLTEDAATNYLHAAAAYLQADQLDQAAEVLDEALQRSAATPEILTLLARVEQRQGRLERSASLTEEALTMQPDYAPAHLQLGDVYRDLGWLESAADSYRQALLADPTGAAVARERLVRTLLEAGLAAEAATECRGFLAESPSAPLLAALGDVLQSRGDLGGAAGAYEDALDRDGRCLLARCGLAEVLLARGDTAGASAAAREVLDRDPSLARAHACLSKACVQSEDYLGAYGHAVKAEQAGVNMAEVWAQLQGGQ